MATLEEAKAAWRRQQSKFEKRMETRVAYLGDNRGTSTSNLIVPADNTFVYAREKYDDNRYFPVKMNRNVKPAFNLPVVIGKREGDPFHRIIDVHSPFVDYNSSGSIVAGVAPHHTQHEFGGGDEVFIDSRLFKPGLLRPTDPPSMSATILSFYYYYEDLEYFSQAQTEDLSQFISSNGNRFVTISFDHESDSIKYTLGEIFGQTFDVSLSTVANKIPQPPGDSYPVGAVLLTPTTATIDWRSSGVNNIYDIRTFNTYSPKRILDRIEGLEGYLGYSPTLTTLGVSEDNQSSFNGIIDGGYF